MAKYSLKQNIQTHFNSQIIKDINDSLESSYNDEEIKQFIIKSVNTLLSEIGNQSYFPVYSRCDIQISQWLSAEHITPENNFDISINWRSGATEHQLGVNIYCHYAWFTWIVWCLIFTSSFIVCFLFLPRPYSARQQDWLKNGENQLSSKQLKRSAFLIEQLSDTQYKWFLSAISAKTWQQADLLACLGSSDFTSLGSEQLNWFAFSYFHYNKQLKPALSAANAKPSLIFDLKQKTITVHGITIALPITPFLYYFWYAQRRVKDIDNGWLLNPANNKSSPQLSESLAQLMQTYQGNTRAINDLLQNGLTPKKLDQNRNRIKDEMLAIIPETLVSHYLFESKRDPKTARFTCRLILSEQNIEFKNLKELI
ncbi:hypothetical protein RS130_19940 [Paraglaciecola aquimarina]|uniref:DUF4129 domain-containing protein n=1 Tax=Paraglaciecola aquimarina TaxID=1235557 RepID=A0ABU3T0R5_9ALTE|nr:hypothetical protein [Paraglaciecola aquimarina]MDU0355854.1 hypothetical protein [Paraglaciecola aquimarina]